MEALSELQQDILTEAFNMSMGQAAAALSEIVNEEIQLSVPELHFLSRIKAAAMLGEESSHLTGVSQKFSGPFGGRALLLFPSESSLQLVRILLQDSVPLDKMTEFEEESLNEIGNIILNSGIGSIANLFGQEILTEIPQFLQGASLEILNIASENTADEDVVLFLRVDFSLSQREVKGYVVFLLDVRSVASLRDHVDSYLRKNHLI